MAKNANELVPVEFLFPVVDMGEGDLADEMDGIYLTFDRVKIPSGGGLAFEVPGDDPDNPELVKELVGVIIDHYPVQTYWRSKFSGENTPPDCYSNDGKIGIGDPGGSCKNCPLNQWGSAEGGVGKACTSKRKIFILREGDGLPIQLTLPPTSLKNFNEYVAKRIVAKGRRTWGVVTRITLKRVKNASGIDYSEAQFAVVRDLNDGEKVKSKVYASEMKQFTRQASVMDDYESANTASEPIEISDEDLPFA